MSLPIAPLHALALAGYLPDQASTVAPGVDRVFMLLFWVSAFFLALIVGLTALFVIRYRRHAGRREPEASPDHSTKLEIFWSSIPLLLVFVIFGASTKVYWEMTAQAPDGQALQVKVTAKKWSWWFDHPSGKGAKELHLVAGRPVELVLGSVDVIHSLYVPQFRLKQDAVPGRYTRMRFTPSKPGSFPIVCAEYCGTNHSKMDAVAVVHPDQASFDAWAKEGLEPSLSLPELGKKLFDEKGCTACHSDDGTAGVGPSVKGLFGRTEKLAGGKTVKVDEDYLRESIVKPGAKLVDGFDDVMPPTALEERELLAIIAYLQTLKETP